MNEVFDALAHPVRRQILEMLKDGGMTAGTLADAFPLSKPTMSAHFAKLKSAGLIQGESRRGSITYTVNVSALEEVILGFMGRMGIGENKEDPRCIPARL
ncbi:transcriptional regulator [Polymorphobacter multimanifer]|uniref:DNA-binding transcriptional ArsR family regulator n=1 Tax=Polymorphobacter multimanifer TaxID=1070431 RepID=A0A841LJL7_9SPHN|nr:metalloregulator ArsR/SmtB family transcription factor [Polymorphobacter multimanifer]MBB6229422.1 DNA-binding transcriptional ArsR family regulator [Polymorphobacter multimanifer]GGI90450.1 transcriptional regulator [Polymorphobacter multimanifer]